MSENSRTYRALSVVPLMFAVTASADRLPREQQQSLTPRAAAQIDVTGFWVSVVTEGWGYRMRMPAKGDGGGIPLNAAGRKRANEWDPARELPNSCQAYGAAGVMRRPGRLHIEWQDDETLQVRTDAGSQARLFHFAKFLPPEGFGTSEMPRALLTGYPGPAVPARQGYSVAAWKKVAQREAWEIYWTVTPAPKPAEHGGLAVVTTQLKPGYLQINGIPYSAQTVLTEYFDRIQLPNGDDYLIVTSIVDDPVYLGEPYVTSTQFKREQDGSRWAPSPCEER